MTLLETLTGETTPEARIRLALSSGPKTGRELRTETGLGPGIYEPLSEMWERGTVKTDETGRYWLDPRLHEED